MKARRARPRIKVGVLEEMRSASTGLRWFRLKFGRLQFVAIDHGYTQKHHRLNLIGEFEMFAVEDTVAATKIDRDVDRKSRRGRFADEHQRRVAQARANGILPAEPATPAKKARRSKKSKAEAAAKETLQRIGVGEGGLDDGRPIPL